MGAAGFWFYPEVGGVGVGAYDFEAGGGGVVMADCEGDEGGTEGVLALKVVFSAFF